MVHESILAITFIFFCLLLQLQLSHSAEFNVGGGANGWSYGVVNWSNGKSFKAGDILVFKYDPQQHNVAVVDAAGYKACRSTSGSLISASGHDRITLARGNNYFLCSVPEDGPLASFGEMDVEFGVDSLGSRDAPFFSVEGFLQLFFIASRNKLLL